jgi:hypothetical protein
MPSVCTRQTHQPCQLDVTRHFLPRASSYADDQTLHSVYMYVLTLVCMPSPMFTYADREFSSTIHFAKRFWSFVNRFWPFVERYLNFSQRSWQSKYYVIPVVTKICTIYGQW